MKSICETDAYGNKRWYVNDQLHREDGPAVEDVDGYKAWWLNGKCHRKDGPAIEYTNGAKLWFYHGKRIDCKNNKEFLRIIKMKLFW